MEKHFQNQTETNEKVTDNTDIQHSEIFPTLTTLSDNITSNVVTFTSFSNVYQTDKDMVQMREGDLGNVLHVTQEGTVNLMSKIHGKISNIFRIFVSK